MTKPAHYKFIAAGLLALITIVVYLPALRNNFVNWDDTIYVYDNAHIRTLNGDTVRWAFTDLSAGFWHPLTWLSLAADHALWGLNPFGYHLTAVILHVINTLLVFLVSLVLIEAAHKRPSRAVASPGPGPRGGTAVLDERGIVLAAAATGLLFGLHPLHVESVAWIAERKDVLCALFFLASMIAYARYAGSLQDSAAPPGRPLFLRNRHYLLSLAAFLLALSAKTMAVSLPLVLLMLDWYPFRRLEDRKGVVRAVAEKLPFMAASLAISFISVRAQTGAGALDLTAVIPLQVRLLVALKGLVAYLGKMALPLHLSAFYPYPRNVSLLSIEHVAAAVMVIGITAACILFARSHAYLLAAWAYYVVTLLPVLQVVQIGEFSMADRFTYLPSLGPFLLAGLATARIATLSKRGPFLRAPVAAAGLIVLAAISHLTVKQISIWKDSITLWTSVIERYPDRVPFAYNSRGSAYAAMGMPDKAVSDYKKALSLDPAMYDAYFNLGTLYGKIHFLGQAIEYFNKAIEIDPARAETYESRGLSYMYLGRPDMALDDFDRAIARKRDFARVYFHRGMLFRTMSDKDRAMANLRRACDLGYAAGCDALRGP